MRVMAFGCLVDQFFQDLVTMSDREAYASRGPRSQAVFGILGDSQLCFVHARYVE
jgi:hypothetical protein